MSTEQEEPNEPRGTDPKSTGPVYFAALPSSVRALWAKSGAPFGHSLLAHMLDVAAVASVLLDREPSSSLRWAGERFGLAPKDAAKWCAAIAGLHDFGKATSAFQSKWAPGQAADEAAGLVFDSRAGMVSRHDYSGSWLLREELGKRVGRAPWIPAVVHALGGHHGFVPRRDEVQSSRPTFEGPDWATAREQLFLAYWSVFDIPESPGCEIPDFPGATWLAGLTSIADWVASNVGWFPPGERGESLLLHFERARSLSRAAMAEIPWPTYRVLEPENCGTQELLSRAVGRGAVVPRPLQLAGDELLSKAAGPTLMIVEAPMGEGKTELAFLAHLRLQERNGHRGLYVALPTQATGNAMHERTLTFLRGFASGTDIEVQLVHGGSALSRPSPRLAGVDDSARESTSCASWFTQRKRPLIAPYGVGTIDQALFGALHVKHHFVRLWGLSNRVVVLDEVHAYDTYTGGIIEGLLRWLRELNCSVILLSATLPASKRQSLLRAWGAGDPPLAVYPRLLMTRGDAVEAVHVDAREMGDIEVLGLAETLDGLLERTLLELAEGGCGVVILNTVQRAQDFYRALLLRVPAGVDLHLLHSRFPAEERSARERRAMGAFGPPTNSKRPRAALLVATQVVEQSLDVDFDFMLSDLAPVDLLLQRAGRLHRHERQRPLRHSQARLFVAGLLPDREPELKNTRWGYVYEPYVLYRTWARLRGLGQWKMPEDIDRLVQWVYGDLDLDEGMQDEFVKRLDHSLGEYLARQQEHRKKAGFVCLEAKTEPQSAYSTKPRARIEEERTGIQVVTRLGDEGVVVVPVEVSTDGWRVQADSDPFDPERDVEESTAWALFRRQLRVSRKDLVTALCAETLPAGFEGHPLLQHLRPIRLSKGVASFGGLRVMLDPELGLLYESREAK